MSGFCGCSFSIRCKKRSACRPSRKAARGVCVLLHAKKRPDGSAGRAGRAEMTDRKGWPKLDGSQRGQVHPGLIRQYPVLVRPSSGERPWPPCSLECRKAAGPRRFRSQLAGRMAVKRYEMGSKWLRLGRTCYVAGYGANPLMSSCCVQLTSNGRQEIDSHISLIFNNLRRKSSFPNFRKNRKT